MFGHNIIIRIRELGYGRARDGQTGKIINKCNMMTRIFIMIMMLCPWIVNCRLAHIICRLKALLCCNDNNRCIVHAQMLFML